MAAFWFTSHSLPRQIHIDKDRKKERYSYCTKEGITLLRGLLGSLAWLAKETQPDLAGRVAIMMEANALGKEAVKYAQMGIVIPIHPVSASLCGNRFWCLLRKCQDSRRGGDQRLLGREGQVLDSSSSTTTTGPLSSRRSPRRPQLS